MLENDLLEAIIGMPTDMFYNTGISTYVWVVSNHKPPRPLAEIDAELKGVTDRILTMMGGLSA